MIIAGSEDLTYFHQLEIEFHNVHTVICNSAFKVDTSQEVIGLIEDNKDEISLNTKYGVVKDNTIFKIVSEDNQGFYIISETISYRNQVVKYYQA